MQFFLAIDVDSEHGTIDIMDHIQFKPPVVDVILNELSVVVMQRTIVDVQH
jgi:hypothetical protein